MIDSWMLSKLTPLNCSPLIILRDPQRLSQRGDFALSGCATGSRLRQEVAWGKPGNLVWFKIIEISLRVFVFV